MAKTQIAIFTSTLSPRFLYVIGEIFERQLGFEVKIFTDKSDFLLHSGFRISYGTFIDEKIPHIGSNGLLDEIGVKELKIYVLEYDTVPYFFQLTSDIHAALPFDLFSAVFYMLSRYEEYLPYQTDKHGRFAAKNSVAYANGFLDKPVVQLWVKQLEEVLVEFYPEIIINPKKYSFKATFDIDVAYAYRHRNLVWHFLSMGKDIFELKFANFFNRIMVLIGIKKDPFDTYNELIELIKTEKLEAYFFLQCGKYSGRVDKSLLRDNSIWNDFVNKLSEFAKIGIHPSFSSNYNKKHFENEIDLFNSICQKDLKISRQHFLKLKMPNTYRNLLYAGIEEDFTMGFADECGFRAGTSKPFYFYDLDLEMVSNLLIHPFVIMDGTLREYLKLNQEQALEKFYYYKSIIKYFGGEFTLLSHNNTFSDFGEWKGWKEVFVQMLKEGK